MPAGWTMKQIKDGTGALINMRVWDETGSGPFVFGSMVTDGTGVTIPPAIQVGGSTPNIVSQTENALVVALSPNSWDKGPGTGNNNTQRVIIDGSQVSQTGPQLSSASIPVVQSLDGQGFLSATSFTPSGVYAGPIEVGPLLTFPMRTAGIVSGVVQDAAINLPVNFTSSVVFDLYLFSASPSGTFTDNAAPPTLAVAEMKKCFGPISMSRFYGAFGPTVFKPLLTAFNPIPFSLTGGSTSLFGVVVLETGYTTPNLGTTANSVQVQLAII